MLSIVIVGIPLALTGESLKIAITGSVPCRKERERIMRKEGQTSVSPESSCLNYCYKEAVSKT